MQTLRVFSQPKLIYGWFKLSAWFRGPDDFWGPVMEAFDVQFGHSCVLYPHWTLLLAAAQRILIGLESPLSGDVCKNAIGRISRSHWAWILSIDF